MLQENSKIKSGDIIGFRLVSGEELMGKIKIIESDHYVLEKPQLLGSSPQGDVGLYPYTFLADPTSDVQLNKHSIASVYSVKEEYLASYISATTGIEVTANKIIT